MEAFLSLDRATRWKPAAAIPIRFPTHHPQGMVRVGDRIFFSSVETVDRAAGVGVGHLFEADLKGRLRRHTTLGGGPLYHPGGIDFDGARLWIPVAEYRPDSSTLIYAVEIESLEAQPVFRFPDHLGALLYDRGTRSLVGVSWGARRIYRWRLRREGSLWVPEQPSNPDKRLNPSHYIDYQDCQYLEGTRYGLCGGLYRYTVPADEPVEFALGGLELLNLDTLRPDHQIPVPLWVRPRLVMTHNPTFASWNEGRLLFHFLPEDDESTLYLFEALPR